VIYIATVPKSIERRTLKGVIIEGRNKQCIFVVACIKLKCTAYESRFLNAEEKVSKRISRIVFVH
jgi:hypothetical protein